ncbi:chemotaxis protein CheW [Chitinimonas koreensis]|nr:chemotaxis protein CheW [Chitinimonas koreensis]
MPLAPPSLLGLVDLRGETLPIVSLRRLLQLDRQADLDEAAEPDGQALVVDVGLPVGLLVDCVDGIVEVAPEALEGVGALRSAIDVHALAAVIRSPDGMVTVLDLDSLVGRDFPKFDAALHGQYAGQPVTAKIARDERRLVSYLLDGQEYATPIDQLREIVGLPEQMLRPPGHERGHLLGVMSLRGRLLPLLGLRRLFGLPDPADASAGRVVVLQAHGGEPVGVVVDAVNAVLSVDRAEIDTLPELFGHGTGRHRISGMCRLDGGRRLVGLIEADCLPGTAPTGEAASAHEIRPAEPARSDEQFVVFRLDREEFGVPIAQVQEIVRRPEQLRHVPGTPDFLEGVASLRGNLLGVVDQRRRFAMAPLAGNEQQRVMVFRFGERCLGFIVDSVSEVLRIPLDAIGATPPLTAGTRRMLSRVANLAGAAASCSCSIRPNCSIRTKRRRSPASAPRRAYPEPASVAPSAAAAARLPGLPRGTERVLIVVDDEPNMLSALVRLFRRDGYRIRTGLSGAEGLALLAADPVAVVLADLRMPHMNGAEFLAEAGRHFPATVRLVLSGCTELGPVAAAVEQGLAWRFLSKPWNDEQLRAMVASAFELLALQQSNASQLATLRAGRIASPGPGG